MVCVPGQHPALVGISRQPASRTTGWPDVNLRRGDRLSRALSGIVRRRISYEPVIAASSRKEKSPPAVCFGSQGDDTSAPTRAGEMNWPIWGP